MTVIAAVLGLLIALAVLYFALRFVMRIVALVISVVLALAAAGLGGGIAALALTLVGQAAGWPQPEASGALLGLLVFVGVLVLIGRWAATQSEDSAVRPPALVVPEPEPEPEPQESDPTVRAAWARLAELSPRQGVRLRAARRDCAALLVLAEGDTLDPALIECATLIRRHLPALVAKVDALYPGASAAERAELVAALVEDVERLADAARAEMERHRAGLRDDLAALRRHVAARTAS